MDERDTHGLIDVVVVKPFKELRTPCPPAGTHGQLYAFDGERACVRFACPMIDTEGAEWDRDDGYMRLQFEMDEIEVSNAEVRGCPIKEG